MKKVWIVGKDGLVGSQLCLDLKEKGIEFVASGHSEVDALDSLGLESYFEKHHPTHVINAVAHVRVDAAEKEEKDLCFDLNITVVERIAKLCKQKGVKLVHISTDYVFDGQKEEPYEVDDLVNPINVYGKTKLEGEKKLFEIMPNACCVRTASVYGITKSGLIDGILKALRENQEVRNISDQTSTPTNAKDLSLALIDMLDYSGLYQFVNEGSASRFDLTQDIFNYCKEHEIAVECKSLKKISQGETSRAATRPKNATLSNAKIKPLLSFCIRSYRQALFEHLEHLLKVGQKQK